MQFNQYLSSRRQIDVAYTPSVLRNTYLLLSMTLLFSAATAAYAVVNQASYGSSLLAMIVAFVLLFAIGALRNSGWGIVGVFAFTGLMGYSLGPMLNYVIKGYSNGGALIMTAFAGTGLTFLLSSLYLLTTKRDLSGWGKFLMTGLVVCIIGGLANLFLKMPAMQLAISTLMVFISTMLMMYDTSRIINNGERNYLMATISLYLDILMLFQNLLILLTSFSNRN